MFRIRIPAAAWPRIDRAINAARRARNEGVPAQFHERVSQFAVQRDAHTGRLVVSAVAFGAGVERVRAAVPGEQWVNLR